MVVVADGLAVAHAQDVLAHTAVRGALLQLISHTLPYKTAGIAFIEIVIDLRLPLQQHHLARPREEVDVRVDAAELVQVIVRLPVGLVTRGALAQRVNHRVTAHTRVPDHAHGDHLPPGLLDLLEELSEERSESIPA